MLIWAFLHSIFKIKNMNYTKRRDPFTGEEFIPLRFNQKFSNRQNQVAFNNEKARNKRHKKLNVDKKLDKNREILMMVLGEAKFVTKSQDYLLGAGFDFMFFSQSAMVGKLKCQFVYEYYIVETADSMFTIKKHSK